MITIRLQRRGRKNDPSYRVIVVDSKKKPKTGSYLEMVGSYDPRSDRVELKGERIQQWIQNGATVSDTVHNLLVSNKIIDAKKINVLPKKTVATVEVPAEAPAPVVEAPTMPAAEAEVAPEVASEIAVEETPMDATPVTNDVAEEVAAE